MAGQLIAYAVTGVDPAYQLPDATLNPHAGTIALGHPIGATGAVLVTNLRHELARTRRHLRARGAGARQSRCATRLA